MESNDIKAHWHRWATEFREDLRATTKTSSIKALEVDALARAIRDFGRGKALRVLEVGCGNGHNCFGLAEQFPEIEFTGVDYIEEMIGSAVVINQNHSCRDRLSFFCGDILELDQLGQLEEAYDIVFTNRCVINLNTDVAQQRALDQLSTKVHRSGRLLMIENSQQSHRRQNDLREAVGLARRPIAEFNHFIDEEKLLPHVLNSWSLLEIDNFASLHDILLYVLLPLLNEGKVDYDHPLMSKATELLLGISNSESNSFGDFGQNRLYVFERHS